MPSIEEIEGDSSVSEGEEETIASTPTDQHPTPTEDGPSSSQLTKKKKKKKSKAARALDSITSKVSLSREAQIPQELVDHVYDQVKRENPEEIKDLNPEGVRRALAALKVLDVVEGKSGLGGKNKKDMGEHKVR
jgi:glycylpeptide N-tetradecanoyltransferase